MKNKNNSNEEFIKERSSLLKDLQSYPLDMKISLCRQRLREFLRENDVYFSFSGGKDSEVLVHIGAILLKELGYKEMHVVYINAGLDYLSVRKFVREFCTYIEKSIGIEVVLHERTPETSFYQVLRTDGYPLISKEVSQAIREARIGLKKGDGTYQYRIDKLNGTYTNKDGCLSAYNMGKYGFLINSPIPISEHCCHKTKKDPAIAFENETGRKPVIATMAQESRNRRTTWITHGCNVFDGNRPKSNPMSFFMQNDVLEYIYRNNLPIAAPYGRIVAKSEKTGQYDMLNIIGPYEGCQYCTTGCDRTGCIYCLFGITSDLHRIERLQRLEPERADYVLRGGEMDIDGYWRPNKEGLGYWFILEYLKKYGNIVVPYQGNYG